MEWLKLAIGFFVANVFGYGGGPSSIPLMYKEIVTHYGWLDAAGFSNMLALGNALPGPIATKIAAYVGYDVWGWTGLSVAVAATVVPSAIALILLIRALNRYRTSSVVKGMTLLVQPVIASMMIIMTWQSSRTSVLSIGWIQFGGIAAVSYWLMNRKKIHPAFLIVAAFLYGGLFLS
ncbi:chromate transporter [Paenibacillus hemerocallicola]|uniref:Chromate transporter n=1 Tax=Paenibacillus hemerocallicola TaxID=1172614 RepID=A0A5C4T053_9BACL|nr:chromate transporter [Paenibacillus hemerocallicola]TNJ62353.1 chromate transporter [Paenibacillus hemerocallicola]